jgi:hypothetical protein
VPARHCVTGLIITSGAIALVLLAASPRGLFSGDEGIKLAETQGLAFTSFHDASLYDPGAKLAGDRTLDAFAASSEFTLSGDDPAKLYGTYPLLYPALAVPLYRLGGVRGMALLSLAGFIAVLVLTARLARRCLVSERAVAAAVAVAGLGCTLPLYATTIFEHTAGAALLLAALDTILGDPIGARRMWLGGALFGVATCFRTELYAFAPSMALVLAWRIGLRRPAWLRWLAFGSGAIAVVIAFLACHRLATPAWHPTLAASSDGEVLTLYHRLGQLVATDLLPCGQILIVATIVVGAWRSLPFVRRPSPLVTAALGAAWSVTTWFAIRNVESLDARTVTGLFTATPVLTLALLRGVGPIVRTESPLGVLVAAASLFAAIIVILPKASSGGGLELGARYLLPVIPLLAIAAAEAGRRHPIERACWAILFAAGVWTTVINARSQWRVRELGAHIVTAVERSEAPVVFSEVWWVAQLAVPVQSEGVSLFVGDRPTAIYDRLYEVGVRRVLSLRGRAPPPTGRVRLRLLPQTVVDDPRIHPQVYELMSPSPAATSTVPPTRVPQ